MIESRAMGSSLARAAGKTARWPRPPRSWAATALAAVATASVVALGLAPAQAAQAAQHPNGFPAINLVWNQTVNDAGSPIAISSPNLVMLNGAPTVVVGDRAGNLLAYNVDSGAGGTLFHAPGPIDSTPSQVPGQNGVLFGVGNAASPYGGGYFGVDANGGLMWQQSVVNQPGDPKPYNAVAAGLAVGSAPGIGAFAVAGSIGQTMYSLTPGGGTVFTFFQGDGDFSTPAIGNLYYGGTPYIVDYGDSSPGIGPNGETYTSGSILRILNPSGQQQCQATTNQSGESSPAIGQLIPNASPLIVAGSTYYFPGASDTNKLFAWDVHCNRVWTDTLDGEPMAGPALANTMGNGQLQVLEGTNIGNANSSGTVYDIDPAGNILWQQPATGAVIGSISTVDPDDQGYQDLLVPTTQGVMVMDGKTGATLAVLEPHEAFQSAPLVTTDANGTIGITIAGYNNANQGVVDHFEIAGSTGNAKPVTHPATEDVLNQAGGWPMFHHDSQLTGNAGIAQPNLQVPCNPPSGGLYGYYEAASDGGVFNFGNLPFCGSTGSITLNKPIVCIAATHDGGGYWMVASDGGIFAFGDAQFYGSMGGQPLNKPIVGMAATPDGGGYYLVASDGGIFAFGDAQFYGSTGNIALNKPIVGIALTPDGRGYYLVASDGGIFAFGDAQFYGSMGGQPLNKPIVGMAADAATGGYWMVASDGGIFSFPTGGGGTPFYGSTGGTPLNKPIVGMEAVPGGSGYRFVASDGGIFSFPTGPTGTPFYGSMGGQPLNQPIVGMSGY